MSIILDSNFLFAIAFKQDKNFTRAYEILLWLKDNDIKLLITNSLVLEETTTLTVARFNGSAFHLDKIHELFWGKDNFFQIDYTLLDEYQMIFSILKKFTSPKRLLSFVDASLIYLSQKFNTKKLVSFDHHFKGILERIY